MKFEIKKLLQEKAVPFEGVIFHKELTGIEGKLGDEGALVKGEIKKLSKATFLVDFTLTATMNYPCARCLEPTAISCNYEYTETVIIDENALVLDMIPLIEECIYINEPFRVLCDDDCEGLCLKCGKNLNQEQCDCDKIGEIDPRLEALSKLLF
ncbi:MAG: YceD family protein [Eubacteriaceae bacterium]